MAEHYLGIDTSGYTASVAVVCQGEIVTDRRQVLPVGQGKRGLRQSEAVFAHIRCLPTLVEKTLRDVSPEKICGIAVSTKPRSLQDSYMPVFMVGKSIATVLEAALDVPCHHMSHQDAHLWAGRFSASGPQLTTEPFLALHVSGGTTELLRVQQNSDRSFDCHVVGATSDMTAGQFIDRIGVQFGLAFPAGPQLEKLAGQWTEKVSLPIFHRHGQVSFSGPHTAASRLVTDETPENIARAVLVAISRTLQEQVLWAANKTGIRQLLLVGGVLSNALIKNHLQQSLDRMEVFASEADLSRDSAVGAAVFAALASSDRSMLQRLGMHLV